MRKRPAFFSPPTFVVEPFRFSISNLPLKTSAAVKCLSSAADDSDSLDFAIYFRPPLSKNDAKRVRVSATYCGKKMMISSMHVFSSLVIPLKSGREHILLKGELEYLLFETHQLRTYNQGSVVGTLYVSFENNMVTPNQDTHDCWQLQLDLNLQLMPRLVPGEFLMWFPPDVDPQQYGLQIDPTLIPQRTPLWFKLRGQISGTKAYTLIGFWVPKKGPYNFYESGKFNNFSRAAMRLGSISEERALLAYHAHYTHRRFQEMGWCPAPEGYPVGWGASPDGLLLDPKMSWNALSRAARAAYGSSLDITRGVCEIKTSRTKHDVSAYFLPQVYMEMISLQCVWADLLRFQRTSDGEDTLYVYRIYRDPQLEKDLMALWKSALPRVANLVEVVKERAFEDMRSRLEAEARQMEPVAIIKLPTALAEEYDCYKETLLSFQQQEEEDDLLLWGDLNERHQKLLRTSSAREALTLMAEQIETYGALMKQIIQQQKE